MLFVSLHDGPPQLNADLPTPDQSQFVTFKQTGLIQNNEKQTNFLNNPGLKAVLFEM